MATRPLIFGLLALCVAFAPLEARVQVRDNSSTSSGSSSSIATSSSISTTSSSNSIARPECRGRHVFAHALPDKFNARLRYSAQEAATMDQDWSTPYMLSHLQRSSANGGLGNPIPSVIRQPLRGLEGVWYETDQNALEVIFHARMRTYDCLVQDHEQADLVYVPYFGGFDALRHMHKEPSTRDVLPLELLSLLQAHPAWQRSNGSDHFMVLGRNVWDFFRQGPTGWGSQLLTMPAVRHNMWTLVVETTWGEPRVISAPKPTAFHPQKKWQLQRWQEFVHGQERKWLFSFAGGARRPDTPEGALREKLFWQCRNSDQCSTVTCLMQGDSTRCDSVASFFKLYLSSTFCLHPIGDACTRRSVLDGMLAGCIPVVFRDCTLETQFQWHFFNQRAKDAGKFFIYIDPETLMGPQAQNSSTSGSTTPPTSLSQDQMVLLEDVLSKISPEETLLMRKRVVDLIPALTYGGFSQENGTFTRPDFKDAIDIIIEGLVEHAVPKEPRADAK